MSVKNKLQLYSHEYGMLFFFSWDGLALEDVQQRLRTLENLHVPTPMPNYLNGAITVEQCPRAEPVSGSSPDSIQENISCLYTFSWLPSDCVALCVHVPEDLCGYNAHFD